jgi:N-acetylneuraminic acid mutarotase
VEISMRKSIALLLVLVFLTASCLIAAKPAFSSADTAEDTWAAKAPMQQARAGLGVAVVNGKIYAIGGSTVQTKLTCYVSGGIVNVNEEYNPATDTWNTRKPMPTPRAYFATAVYQKRVYCIGGFSGFSNVSGALENATCVNEFYDTATDTWATMSPMPIASAKLKANVVNDKIYLLGGNANPALIQVYDPKTDSWATGTAIPDTSFLFGSAVVDDRIYALVQFSGKIGFNSQIKIYDPAADNWSSGAIGLHDFSSVVAATTGVMAPKRIYALSGWATMATNSDGTGSQPFGGPPEKSNQIYDPKNDSWSFGAPKRSERQGFGVAVVDDKLYVIGGFVRRYPITFGWGLYDDTPTAENELYKPVGYGTPDQFYVQETTPPKISVLSSFNQTYNESSVFLVFTVDKPVNWIGYSLDGEENVTVTGNFTLTGLSNGLHNVTVYAKDTFENVGASATVTFTVAKPEPFPATLVVTASGVAVAVVGAGLLVYFKKHKH